jgi:hypothetical protein
MRVEIVEGYEAQEAMGMLLSEYFEFLLAGGGQEARDCLALQDYASEVGRLRTLYGPPDGRLYLLRCDGEAAGCIALKKLEEGIGELKRLYVRPIFQGKGFANLLMDRLLEEARGIGYRYLRLDTFSYLRAALALYARYGFYRIPRYNDNPVPEAVFLQLEL